MSAVFFLLIVVVISVVGCTIVYLRQRPSSSVESGIDSFRREMQALGSSTDDGPEDAQDAVHGRRRGRGRL